MDDVDQERVLAEARNVVQRVEHRSEEEPRQEQRRDEVLDVPVERVQRRNRERDPGDEADGERRERDREPDRATCLGDVDETEPDHDREHDDEADELGRDGRERHELAREAHLADQVRVLEQAPRRGLQRGREEDPDGEPRKQEEPVVLGVGGLDLEHHAEDEEVDEHQHDRMRERPEEAERRALVLRAQVAAEEAPEELPITIEVEVGSHRGI